MIGWKCKGEKMSLTNDTSCSDESLRGDIWETELPQAVGDELKKSPRRCVIISADGLQSLKVKLVVPLREWKQSHENNFWCVPIDPTVKNGLIKKSTADALQARCVSTERLCNKLGVVSADVMENIVAALAMVIDYV